MILLYFRLERMLTILRSNFTLMILILCVFLDLKVCYNKLLILVSYWPHFQL